MQTEQTKATAVQVGGGWMASRDLSDWHLAGQFDPKQHRGVHALAVANLKPAGIDSAAVLITWDDFDRYDILDNHKPQVRLYLRGRQELAEALRKANDWTPDGMARIVAAS